MRERSPLTTVAVILAVVLFSSSGASGRVKVLSDSEGDNPLAGWDAPGKEQDDRSRKSETRIERSAEWASQGKYSIKLTFDSYQKGEGTWRVIKLRLDQIGGSDWTEWDRLEFDVHNPGSTASLAPALRVAQLALPARLELAPVGPSCSRGSS